MYTHKIDHNSQVAVFLDKVLGTLNLRQVAAATAIDYQTSYNVLPIKNLPLAFDNYRILHLSDLHIDAIPDNGERLFSYLSELDFDCCVMTGDYEFESGAESASEQGLLGKALLAKLIQTVDCHDGIFAVAGNHDTRDILNHLSSQSVSVLENETTLIKRGKSAVNILGVDDPLKRRDDDLTMAVTGTIDNLPKILLVHTPQLIQTASDYGIDAYLCGHTHGGQICLPGGIPIKTNLDCNKQFSSGSWQFNAMSGYTSRGIGVSGLPLRVACPPEIIIHTLRNSGRYH